MLKKRHLNFSAASNFLLVVVKSAVLPRISGSHALPDVSTWGVQVVRYPNFFSRGMEADRNVKVVGGDVAVL